MSGREVKTHPGRLLSAKESNQTNASSQTSSLFCVLSSCSAISVDEEAESSRSSAIEFEVLTDSGLGREDADFGDTSL